MVHMSTKTSKGLFAS